MNRPGWDPRRKVIPTVFEDKAPWEQVAKPTIAVANPAAESRRVRILRRSGRQSESTKSDPDLAKKDRSRHNNSGGASALRRPRPGHGDGLMRRSPLGKRIVSYGPGGDPKKVVAPRAWKPTGIAAHSRGGALFAERVHKTIWLHRGERPVFVYRGGGGLRSHRKRGAFARPGHAHRDRCASEELGLVVSNRGPDGRESMGEAVSIAWRRPRKRDGMSGVQGSAKIPSVKSTFATGPVGLQSLRSQNGPRAQTLKPSGIRNTVRAWSRLPPPGSERLYVTEGGKSFFRASGQR